MATSLLWITLPSVVIGLVLSLALPEPGPPPRWRARLGGWFRRMGTRLVPSSLRRSREAHLRSRRKEPDPFEVLSLQLRLGVLAQQLRALEADPHVYGRAHRLTAAQSAYDALLAEACRLAGVDVSAPPLRPRVVPDEPERFREEMELASRGWSW